MELNDLYEGYLNGLEGMPDLIAPKGCRKVSIPDVDTMNKYLFRHFRKFMLDEISTWLHQGVMACYLDCDIDISCITANECRFGNVTFWRVNRTTMIADIDLHLQLPCNGGLEFMDMYLSLLFDMEGGISCEVYDYGMLDNKPERDLWMLSPFLVPYLSKGEIDNGIVEIWKGNIPEALGNHHYRNPYRLAKALGLEIKHLRLHKQNKTRSILFFIKDTVLVDAEKGEPPVPVEVPANTIVINENLIPVDNAALEIYHECIHYEWHFMFYMLQAMYNNDLRQLRIKKVFAKDIKVSRNPIRWIEWQARYGSFGLMMPAPEFGPLFNDEYHKIANCFRHAGDRYEFIANRLSRLYNLRKCYVRARMIQLGHIEAQGALNYVVDHYIDAFAVSSTRNLDTDFTFVTDPQTILDMYEEDENFRKVIDTGRFIYADGHLVLNNNKFVRMTSQGPRLTPWANKNVDQCCLRFVRKYEQYNLGEYTFGRLYCDAEYLKRTEFYVNDYMIDGKDAYEAIDDYLEDFPRHIPEAIEVLRKKAGMTRDELVEAAGMSESMLKRLKKKDREQYDLDSLVAICIALQLPPWLSEEFLSRGHWVLGGTKRQNIIKCVLTCMYTTPLIEVQQYLTKRGVPELAIQLKSSEAA